MGFYRVSLDAEQDVTRLYLYGLKRYGEAQADRYFNGLYQQFERIADHPLLYPVDNVRERYRRCPYRSDVIYYRIVGDAVEITAILGRQDREQWL